ncbi:MAG: hypothetical protein WCF85_08510 [Rhodospirillaceae bacterium]
MTAITFDTHLFIKRLVATGMPEPQAETVTALIREAQDGASEQLATKGDISSVRHDIELAKRDLTIRLGGMIIALGGFLAAIKFVGH